MDDLLFRGIPSIDSSISRVSLGGGGGEGGGLILFAPQPPPTFFPRHHGLIHAIPRAYQSGRSAVSCTAIALSQEKLLEYLNTLPSDLARHYSKVSITVPDARFTNATPDVKQELKKFRTVSLQGVKITFGENE